MYKDYNINTKKDKVRFLEDINKNGKDNKWKERKKSNLELANSYKRLGFENKYYRVFDCSTFFEFKYFPTEKIRQLNKANFCKVRLCPVCSWRRSLKIFGQVSKIMDYVEENYNYKYIFLTLTVENCYGEDLKDTLDHMMKSFNKMNQRKVFKQAVKGYFRSLEITYNKENDTYHPHFHIILATNESYFKDTKYYLSQKDWTELWKSCLGVDYTPIVDVRKLRENKGKEVAEVAKYAVKSEDFIIRDSDGKIDEELTDKVVEVLDKALHRKRLTSFGFIFKDIHKELNLDDNEDGDLIRTDNDDELRDDLFYVIERYQWNIGLKNYVLIEIENMKGDE